MSNWLNVIANIGLIGGLVLVAIQIRQNTDQLASNEKAMMRAESASSHEQWSSWRHLLIENAEALDAWRAGNSDYESLDPQQRAQFGLLASDFMWVMNNMWERHEAGVSAEGLWEKNRRAAQRFISSEAGRIWWEASHGGFPKRFVQALEEGLANDA